MSREELRNRLPLPPVGRLTQYVGTLSNEREQWFFLFPASAFYFPFLVLPAVFLLVISFFQWDIIGDMTFVGLDNYQAMLSESRMHQALFNNILFVIHHLLEMAVALLLALGVKHAHPRVRSFAQTAILLPVSALVVGIAILWRFMYNPNFGVVNKLIQSVGIGWNPIWLGNPLTALPGLMIASSWQFIGFSMIIWLVGLMEIDQSLYDAARIDGAGNVAMFYHITLPQLKPAATFLLIFNLIRAFRRFPLVWVMTQGGPSGATEVMVTYMYKVAFLWSNFGQAAALSVILFVITLAVSVIGLKYVWIESASLKET